MITNKRLPVLFRFVGLVFCIVFIVGCEEQSMQPNRSVVSQSSFGLDNDFYGRPNFFQKRNLPQAMRGAYSIEPVRNISMAELREMLSKKQLVAEELNEGNLYVAMRGSRIVKFDTFVAGLVIVIERYRIVDY